MRDEVLVADCEECKKIMESQANLIEAEGAKVHVHEKKMKEKKEKEEKEEESLDLFPDLAKFNPLLHPPSHLQRFIGNFEISDGNANREPDGTEIVSDSFSYSTQQYIGYNRFYTHEIFLR